MKKIGVITCDKDQLKHYFPTAAEPEFIPIEPFFTPDDQLAVNELRKNGYVVEPIVWGCPVSLLKKFDLLIVRSPWDYMDNNDKKNKFMQWITEIEEANINVANPAQFIQWMVDKHYLEDLKNEEIQVISTSYHEKGCILDLSHIFNLKGPFVIKPCISAAGVGLYHIKTAEEAIHYQEEVNARIQQDSYMLQDFIPEISTHGEWSLIFLGGQYSHAVHKKPGEQSILVHAERGGSLSFSNAPPQHLIDFANMTYQKIFPAFQKATLSKCKKELILYLRLDIIDTANGPVLIECEGVEPELFFRARPQSEVTFCEAISHLLRTSFFD